MRKILSIVFLGLFAIANAQDFKTQSIKITKEGVVNPRDYKPDFNASIKNVEMPSPDGDSYKSFLISLTKSDKSGSCCILIVAVPL